MAEHQQAQKSTEAKSNIQKRATPPKQIPTSHPAVIIQRAGINPKSLTHADVLQLQRTIGNKAVGKLLSEIGSVSFNSKHVPVQRQNMSEDEEKPLQSIFVKGSENEACSSCSSLPLQREEENRTGMPENLKAGVENLSGIDMSDVKVHYNSDKPYDVEAQAYTQGTDIHVAPGQERHLPHELWHVVQQAQGRVKPTMQMKDVAVNDDIGLEREADLMGAKVLQMVTSTERSNNQNRSISTAYLQGRTDLKKTNVVQRWAGTEHQAFGNNAVEDLLARLQSVTGKGESHRINPVTVSKSPELYPVRGYGEYTKIAGDHAKKPEDIRKGLDEGLLNYLRMIYIAYTNANHFFPLAAKEWSVHHSNACQIASRLANDIRTENLEPDCSLLTQALIEEAFAAHFLQDTYASGHQYPRALAAISGNWIGDAYKSKTYHDTLCKLENGLPLKEGRFHGDDTADKRDTEVLSLETRNSLLEVFHAAGMLRDIPAETPKPSQGPDVDAILKDKDAAPIWIEMTDETRGTMEEEKKKNSDRNFQTDSGTSFTREEIVKSYSSYYPKASE